MLSSFCEDCGLDDWTSEVLDYFKAYNLPVNGATLSLSSYYKELNELPIDIKRDILHKVIQAWPIICNYKPLALSQAFSRLIYLKICSGAEYFFMSTMKSLISYFGSNGIWIESNDDGLHYELFYDDDANMIAFDIDENSNQLQIIISGSLINRKTPFAFQPSNAQIQPLFDAICSHPFKSQMPWIYANARIDCSYSNSGFDKGILRFNIANIEYIDNNGIN